MADFKISQLPKVTAAGSDDYIIVNKDNNASSIIKVSDLSSDIGGELSSEFLSKTATSGQQTVSEYINFAGTNGENPAFAVSGRSQFRDRVHFGSVINDFSHGFTCAINARFQADTLGYANAQDGVGWKFSPGAPELPLIRNGDGRIHIGGNKDISNGLLTGLNNYPGSLNVAGWFAFQAFHFSDDNQGVNLNLYKSRSATVGERATLKHADNIGQITFNAARTDSNAFFTTTKLVSAIYGPAGTSTGEEVPEGEEMTDFSVYLKGPDSTSAANRRFQIDGKGRIGLNAVHPDAVFCLKGDTVSNSVNQYHIRTFATTDPNVTDSVYGVSSTPAFEDGATIKALFCVDAGIIGDSDSYTISERVYAYRNRVPADTAPLTVGYYSDMNAGVGENYNILCEGTAQGYIGGNFKIGGSRNSPHIAFNTGSAGNPLTRTSEGKLIVGTDTSYGAGALIQATGNGDITGLAVNRFSTNNGPARLSLFRSNSNDYGSMTVPGGNQAIGSVDYAAPNASGTAPINIGSAMVRTLSGSTLPVDEWGDSVGGGKYQVDLRNPYTASNNPNPAFSVDGLGRAGVLGGIHTDSMFTVKGTINFGQALKDNINSVYHIRTFASLPEGVPRSTLMGTNVYIQADAHYSTINCFDAAGGGMEVNGTNADVDRYSMFKGSGIPSLGGNGHFVKIGSGLHLDYDGVLEYEGDDPNAWTKSQILAIDSTGTAPSHLRGYIAQGPYRLWDQTNTYPGKKSPWSDNWLTDNTHDVMLLNSGGTTLSKYQNGENTQHGLLTFNLRGDRCAYINFFRKTRTSDAATDTDRIAWVLPNPNGTGISITNKDGTDTFAVIADRRIKSSVSTITNALDKIKALNAGSNGFIADEVAAVLPEVVEGVANATETVGIIRDADGQILEVDAPEPDDLTYVERTKTQDYVEAVFDDETGDLVTPAIEEVFEDLVKTKTWTETGEIPKYQMIKPGMMIPFLVKALQEAAARIEALEAQVGGS